MFRLIHGPLKNTPPWCKDTDPLHMEAVTMTDSTTVHPQPATEAVIYHDIKGFKNQDVCTHHSNSIVL